MVSLTQKELVEKLIQDIEWAINESRKELNEADKARDREHISQSYWKEVTIRHNAKIEALNYSLRMIQYRL